jgi:hypothetical protein
MSRKVVIAETTIWSKKSLVTFRVIPKVAIIKRILQSAINSFPFAVVLVVGQSNVPTVDGTDCPTITTKVNIQLGWHISLTPGSIIIPTETKKIQHK